MVLRSATTEANRNNDIFYVSLKAGVKSACALLPLLTTGGKEI